MGVGGPETDEKLAFPELLEAEVANVRSLQNITATTNEEIPCCHEISDTQTDSSVDSENSQERLGNTSENSALGSEPNKQCTSICGRILRIMGDEQTSRTYGRHLRSMGDEIFCRYSIRRSLEHLVQAVANERDNENATLRQRPRRPSSS